MRVGLGMHEGEVGLGMHEVEGRVGYASRQW